jgi:mannose-6-phosphate isomerase-like protein (cupin superfamily)
MKINIAQKLTQINEHWSPNIIGELNGQHVKLAKLKGEFVWHHHQNEDELFMVIEGNLKIEFRDKTVELAHGEICIIPKGVEHKPIAEQEVSVLLFEPATTLNTGNTENHFTKRDLKKI